MAFTPEQAISRPVARGSSVRLKWLFLHPLIATMLRTARTVIEQSCARGTKIAHLEMVVAS
jgi:hypothetical protein